MLFTGLLFGQYSGISSKNWKRNTREFRFGFGVTNFLGDLGGRDQVGTGYSPTDVDFNSTGVGAMVGYRWRFHQHWAFTSDVYAGVVKGSDRETDEIIRSSRNLNFRAPIINATQRIEYIILAYEKDGRRFNLRKRKGMRHINNQIYIFGGVGALFYMPQANLNGSWENLRPLKTEGQGLQGGAKAYSNFTLSVPLGFGMRVATGKYWRLGIEFTYNITFSDYIDDVSTDYYDPNILETEVSPLAAYASNPAVENQNWFVAGQQRGDPGENDAILYVNLVFSKNITYSSFRIRSERWRRNPKF